MDSIYHTFHSSIQLSFIIDNTGDFPLSSGRSYQFKQWPSAESAQPTCMGGGERKERRGEERRDRESRGEKGRGGERRGEDGRGLEKSIF